MPKLTLLLLLVVAPATAQRFDPKRVAPNQEELHFNTPSPLSSLEAQKERLGLDAAPEDGPDLSATAFRAYVPKRYSETTPYGLFVWNSPMDIGTLPTAWEKVCDKLKLIAIGPDDVGHDSPVARRVGLLLDAAHNATQRWSIDPERVYVGGFSEGARVPALLALNYPEVFRGGLYIGGVHWYCPVPRIDGGEGYWRGELPAPNPERLTLAKERSRHAFLIGEKDPVFSQTDAVYRVAKRDGFTHLLWLPIPRVGHATPKRKYIQQCLEFLDGKGGKPQGSKD